MEGGPLDSDADAAESARRVGVREQVVCEQRVEIEDGVAVEADLLCGADREFDRVLVVEDHLRLKALLPFRLLAKIDEALGVKQRVGVPLKAARIPGQVDQQPVQYLLRVGAGRLRCDRRRADLAQVRALRRRQIEGFIGAVRIEERAEPTGLRTSGGLRTYASTSVPGFESGRTAFAFRPRLGAPSSRADRYLDLRQCGDGRFRVQ